MARIRDFGIKPGYLPPGPLNAITDVAGVRVGHITVNRDVNDVPWRTGVTAIWPHQGNPLLDRVYAGIFPLNGYGEMTARSVVDEWGLLSFPIMLTGTNHVGIVYHWTLQYLLEHQAKEEGTTSLIAMVAECDDSYLDGSRGLAIGKDDVYEALEGALNGPVAEGSVGAGTGMKLFDFKGGIGSSSRLIEIGEATYTVGVLVLTNLGERRELHIVGVPVGQLISDDRPESVNEGSCIVVLATDAPLSSRQCQRLAERATMGLARAGSIARDSSGEIFVAFATGNMIPNAKKPEINIRALIEGTPSKSSLLSNLFAAAVEATEEAIYNALVAAETTTGVHGHVLHAISHERLQTVLQSSGQFLVRDDKRSGNEQSF
jgi:D-aminopeptidase